MESLQSNERQIMIEKWANDNSHKYTKHKNTIFNDKKQIRSYQRMGVGGGKKFKGTQWNIWEMIVMFGFEMVSGNDFKCMPKLKLYTLHTWVYCH